MSLKVGTVRERARPYVRECVRACACVVAGLGLVASTTPNFDRNNVQRTRRQRLRRYVTNAPKPAAHATTTDDVNDNGTKNKGRFGSARIRVIGINDKYMPGIRKVLSESNGRDAAVDLTLWHYGFSAVSRSQIAGRRDRRRTRSRRYDGDRRVTAGPKEWPVSDGARPL